MVAQRHPAGRPALLFHRRHHGLGRLLERLDRRRICEVERPDGRRPWRRPRYLARQEGEIAGLLGRSGCGKSTLLRIISGLSRPTGGDVTFYGQPVTGPYDGTAMVFQSFALFPWLNVLDNVEIGLRAHGASPAE